MEDSEVAVELRQVTKRFGSFTAVKNVSLRIREGEFFSLLGPSGCGKTTNLRMIAGFELPSDGEIYLHGQPVGQLPPFKR
ncbi:MAG: ATP-binding cassette domain-containing protein, partial [Chloroflexi bacterium]|nr:ATP-binding cassette domain-containing protein [Chloroflexota bacterium]